VINIYLPYKKKVVHSFNNILFFSFFCRCMCEPGYTGKNCESNYVPCSPSPCQHGGTCRPLANFSYECKCPPGKNNLILIKIPHDIDI
jgi:hypothetical protein